MNYMALVIKTLFYIYTYAFLISWNFDKKDNYNLEIHNLFRTSKLIISSNYTQVVEFFHCWIYFHNCFDFLFSSASVHTRKRKTLTACITGYARSDQPLLSLQCFNVLRNSRIWIVGIWIIGTWVVGIWVVGIWVVGVWIVGIWIVKFELSEFELSECELS